MTIRGGWTGSHHHQADAGARPQAPHHRHGDGHPRPDGTEHPRAVASRPHRARCLSHDGRSSGPDARHPHRAGMSGHLHRLRGRRPLRGRRHQARRRTRQQGPSGADQRLPTGPQQTHRRGRPTISSTRCGYATATSRWDPQAPGACIDLEPTGQGAAENVFIESNTLVQDSPAVAVSLSGTSNGPPSRRIRFTGNDLTGGGMGGVNAEDVRVSDNTIVAGPTRPGARLPGDAGPVHSRQRDCGLRRRAHRHHCRPTPDGGHSASHDHRQRDRCPGHRDRPDQRRESPRGLRQPDLRCRDQHRHPGRAQGGARPPRHPHRARQLRHQLRCRWHPTGRQAATGHRRGSPNPMWRCSVSGSAATTSMPTPPPRPPVSPGSASRVPL